MRLDKLLAHSGYGTRKEVKEIIRKGFVLVNGDVIKSDDYKVSEENDEIIVAGNQVNYEKMIYIMLNKPDGYISATFDNNLPTVLDLIYGYESVKGDISSHQNKKESVIILCIITFLINIKDETITYILLQLLLSEYIPDKLNKYIITTPPANPFYSYKWDKDFQNKLNFAKFISLNFSTEFLGSFINKDNYHYKWCRR